MNLWDLLGIYYDLGDGLAWASFSQRVVFDTQESAKQFQTVAPPGWFVGYTR
jgi:hypothetical protein